MKAVPGLAFSIVAIALLSGCAGTREMTSTQPIPQQELTPEQQYIAYVERVAKRRGIQVTWVNLPRLPKKDEQK